MLLLIYKPSVYICIGCVCLPSVGILASFKLKLNYINFNLLEHKRNTNTWETTYPRCLQKKNAAVQQK